MPVPKLAYSWAGVLKSTSLMSVFISSTMLHISCLSWMICEMRDRWLYSHCFVGCCLQDLFKMTHGICAKFLPNFFSMCFVSIDLVHLFGSIKIATAWKKYSFILLDRSDFHIINNLSIAFHAFGWCISVDEMLLLKYVNWFTHFRSLPLPVEMAFYLKYILFYLNSHESQHLLPLVLSYTIGILLGLVYL